MSPRVFAGLALWLGLGVFPAVHLGLRSSEWMALLLPLALLPLGRAAVAFVAAPLPLYVLRPDLASPRAHGAIGILAASTLVAAYLIVALRDPGHPIRPRSSWRRWSPEQALAVATAVVCAAALCAPYLPVVADALRQSYAANLGAATALLAVGCVALGAGLVLVYIAAPLDEAARRQS